MTLAVYPTLPGLTFPLLKAAEFDTLISTAPNKYEVRLPQTVNPLWSWQLIYDFLRDFPSPGFTVTELRTLLDFFLAQGGQAGEFLFTDQDDNSVGPALISGSPNVPLAELQTVTDGSGNYYSPIQRTFGGLFYEDITDLNPVDGTGMQVYANGTLQTLGSNYTIGGPGLAVAGQSFMGLYLNWVGGGNPARPVTAQFDFYFRVRFETDTQDMEKFAKQFWTIGGSESQKGTGQVKLVQARPTPL